MNPAQSRLQIAARIHFFLKRELGAGIDVAAMLQREGYARQVLALCDAARGTELPRLAARFRDTWADDAHHAASARRSSSPPSATWSPTA